MAHLQKAPQEHIFTPLNFPINDCQWGQIENDYTNMLQTYLCDGVSKSVPSVIWLVGEVQQNHFVDKDGNPKDKGSLILRMVEPTALHNARFLLQHFANPAIANDPEKDSTLGMPLRIGYMQS